MAKEIVPTSCRLVGKGIKRIIHRFPSAAGPQPMLLPRERERGRERERNGSRDRSSVAGNREKDLSKRKDLARLQCSVVILIP